MKIKLIIVISFGFILGAPQIYAVKSKNKMVRIGYFNQFFGHLHHNPSQYSSSKAVISCGQALKVMKVVEGKKETVDFAGGWNFVKASAYEGFLLQRFISPTKVQCFKNSYPKFFEAINLPSTERYYWGKLYDQYVYGTSKAQ